MNMRRKYACEKWKRRRMCASARKDDMMEECMNGNNVRARLRLVSMCVFRMRLATMCMFLKAWCKMHGRTNNDTDGTIKVNN